MMSEIEACLHRAIHKQDYRQGTIAMNTDTYIALMDILKMDIQRKDDEIYSRYGAFHLTIDDTIKDEEFRITGV